MNRQIYFISGAYGVGKSTLCDKLSLATEIPTYSASDLISAKVNENYGSQKAVKNKEGNQRALLSAVDALLDTENPIILSGHFRIFNSKQETEVLPDFIFSELVIKKNCPTTCGAFTYTRTTIFTRQEIISNGINKRAVEARAFASK